MRGNLRSGLWPARLGKMVRPRSESDPSQRDRPVQPITAQNASHLPALFRSRSRGSQSPASDSSKVPLIEDWVLRSSLATLVQYKVSSTIYWKIRANQWYINSTQPKIVPILDIPSESFGSPYSSGVCVTSEGKVQSLTLPSSEHDTRRSPSGVKRR